MFDRLKERLDDLSDPSGDSSTLTTRANELFDFIYLLSALQTRFVITMPEYPRQDYEREAWSDAYFDIEDAQLELGTLIKKARNAQTYLHICIKEATEEEQTERDYGTYEDQVRTQFYSTR